MSSIPSNQSEIAMKHAVGSFIYHQRMALHQENKTRETDDDYELDQLTMPTPSEQVWATQLHQLQCHNEARSERVAELKKELAFVENEMQKNDAHQAQIKEKILQQAEFRMLCRRYLGVLKLRQSEDLDRLRTILDGIADIMHLESKAE